MYYLLILSSTPPLFPSCCRGELGYICTLWCLPILACWSCTYAYSASRVTHWCHACTCVLFLVLVLWRSLSVCLAVMMPSHLELCLLGVLFPLVVVLTLLAVLQKVLAVAVPGVTGMQAITRDQPELRLEGRDFLSLWALLKNSWPVFQFPLSVLIYWSKHISNFTSLLLLSSLLSYCFRFLTLLWSFYFMKIKVYYLNYIFN